MEPEISNWPNYLNRPALSHGLIFGSIRPIVVTDPRPSRLSPPCLRADLTLRRVSVSAFHKSASNTADVFQLKQTKTLSHLVLSPTKIKPDFPLIQTGSPKVCNLKPRMDVSLCLYSL
ncbi:hypothetical protein VNO77_27218 [Canavalia gladiata]|uniref:Uncharacterized protein n=1 Tax=Canavalia gladiata TaxID=3824 RepID=A0AAN9KWT8_CANGL